MWPWLKRWLDWAMHDLWPLHRLGPRPQALHFSYEKGGLTVPEQPIPWNAEAVLIEASVRLSGARTKNDFSLHLPDVPPIPAESIHREPSDDRCHVFFRIPTPAASTTAEVRWRSRILGQLTLPVLSCEEFLGNLRIQMPALFVRIADQSVAAQTFVSSQCKGLMASAVITSPTSLAPLRDLGVQVEFRSERSGTICTVPTALTSSQLAGRQALVTAVPVRFPRRTGVFTATWMVGDRPLLTQRFRAITLRSFQRSLRISDTRVVVQSSRDGTRLHRQLPAVGKGDRVGPCFFVASREAGMAGLCPLQVHAVVNGGRQPFLLSDQAILITDGPALVAPGTIDMEDIGQVTGFELRLKERVLGLLSLSPAPAAAFTSEGGFKAPHDFSWTPAADDELSERLAKLMNNPR
jgi:hypothetical protein